MRDRVARRKRKDTTAGVACVASVSNRVIARKLERKQKKNFPLPLLRHSFFFFCSCPSFLDEPTQATAGAKLKNAMLVRGAPFVLRIACPRLSGGGEDGEVKGTRKVGRGGGKGKRRPSRNLEQATLRTVTVFSPYR